MSNTVKFQGKEWEVLKDCGDFNLCKEVGTDNVRNIPKKQAKKETSGQDNNPDSKE